LNRRTSAVSSAAGTGSGRYGSSRQVSRQFIGSYDFGWEIVHELVQRYVGGKS
jgi:hypothetical protein